MPSVRRVSSALDLTIRDETASAGNARRMYHRARGLVAVVVTVGVLASCSGGGKSAQLPPELRSALRSAPVTDVAAASDQETHALFDDVGLRARFGADTDAVYSLLDKARRQAVESEPAPDFTNVVHTKAFVTGPPEVRLVDDTFLQSMPVQFARQFAESLDFFTSKSGSGSGTEDMPERNPASRRDDGKRTVTDNVSESTGVDIAGSVVTLVLGAKLTETITDDKTHSLLVWVTESRTYKGVINICPDPSGGVPLTVTTQLHIDTSTGKSVSSDATLDLQGHVNDQAGLASVDASYENHSKLPGGSIDLSMKNMSLPGTASGYDGSSLNISSATGSVTSTGDETAGLKFAVSDFGLSVNLIEPVMEAAQKLWRNGRCVVVAVPQYNAETPREIAEQGKVQHTEEVDTKSETTFGVTLKHRYGSAPQAPVDLSLSGEDKLDAEHLDAAPGTVTYTAPSDDGKTATVTLTSTSKRGIGKLVIEFDTKSKKLAMSMNGSMTFGSGSITLTAQFRASSAAFKPVGDGTYRASLPATTTYNLTFPGENCSSANGSEGRGTLVFTGTIDQGPDKQPVWHVKLDGKRSVVHENETACGISFSDLPVAAAGGLVGGMASIAGVITFPADGGTVRVNKSLSGFSMNATFVATVPK